MPRKSAAALAMAPLTPRHVTPRLAVPAMLANAEGDVWRATVGALPAQWFGIEQAPLLERYCRHVVRSRCLETLLRDSDPAADLDRYTKLARLVGEESGRILALARSLRLTVQSRTHATTAAHRASAARPQADITTLFEERHDE